METISVGLLGLGTVGGGVARILRENAGHISGRLGALIEVRRIVVKDLSKTRDVDLARVTLSDRAEDVIDDPSIQIVVELVGGVTDAKRFVLAAIERGKHVVTANKALLALHGEEIFAAASAHGVDVFYEGAVGGGIPIIRTLRESFASDRVQRIVGILNGTTNYILTNMAETGADFEGMLAEAQRLGYAEADPTADVDGHDAAQKLAILASLAFSTRLSAKDVSVEGIRRLTAADFTSASQEGYTIKLLGVAERRQEAVAVSVQPCLVPGGSMLAHVNGVLNAVSIESDALGTSVLIGRGAGDLPTGSAVASDVIDLARNILLGSSGRIPHLATRDEAMLPRKVFDEGEVESPFFLRFTVKDTPGVFGRVATALGQAGVSLKTVRQDVDQPGGAVPLLVLTHSASARQVRQAVQTIDHFETTVAPTHVMRVLELD
ncbi:MAG: homoserine dehydrogenase [Deltaproteobacteria bacterium]|nr:homoserine dehydrogenase [Deltaproteobacteria bacterium]